MQAVVDGLMTNYAKHGSGKKVVVCLHGWGDSGQTFAALVKSLGDEFTVLVPDLPGFGGSQEPNSPWGVDEYSRFVVDWLKKIGVKSIYALVGHSNGGAISISLAGSKLLEPKKVVLLASSGIRDANKLRKIVLGGGAKLVKMPLKILPKTTQSKLKRQAYSAIGSDYGLMPEMDASYRKIITQDMQGVATHLKQPTLLVYGTYDKTTPIKYGQLFSEAITNSKLETVEAGHMLHHQQPAEVAKLVKGFLDA
jgi:pimeloyl-ACP methyl ester carboxylesterase